MTSLKWSDLNPVGRAIIVAVAGLTAAVAAVAFALSYGALYAWVRDAGMYSGRLTRLYPLMLDAAFIIAQLAAILGGILKGNRGWPLILMLISGTASIWLNLQHAGHDPGHRLIAALPPVLMMVAFEVDISIVRWVMRALGKPLDQVAPLPPAPGMLGGAAYPLPQGLPQGYGQPPAYWQIPAGQGAYPQIAANWHNGQTGGAFDGDDLKRRIVEEYLAGWSTEAIAATTAQQVSLALIKEGLTVSERTVSSVLAEVRSQRGLPAQRPAPQGRQRGSARTAARKPRKS